MLNKYMVVLVLGLAMSFPVLSGPKNGFERVQQSHCKDQDDQYIYFEDGDELFRYKSGYPIFIPDYALDSDYNKSTMCSPEPLGCRGNPYQRVPIEYKYQPGSDPIGNVKLKTFGFARVLAKDYDKLHFSQLSAEKLFGLSKKKYGWCDVIGGALERCRVPYTGERKKSKYGSSVDYRSFENKYETPTGRPFVVTCPMSYEYPECKVYYRYFQSVNLVYIFSHEELDANNLIDFDMYLRSLINKMHVQRSN